VAKKKQSHWLRKSGIRSGLEDKVKNSLIEKNIPFTYESEKIKFVQPAVSRTYTPDFVFVKKDGSIMFVETKGRWTVEDRKKIALVKDQHPTMDLRMLFQSNNKIRKGSKTTYGDVCDKMNLVWAVGTSVPAT
jgi:hypothetical protein